MTATVRRPCWCGAPATRMVSCDGQASVVCDAHIGEFDMGTSITSVVEVANPWQWALLITHVDDIRAIELQLTVSVVPLPDDMGAGIAHRMAEGTSEDACVIDVVLLMNSGRAHHFIGGRYGALVDVVTS